VNALAQIKNAGAAAPMDALGPAGARPPRMATERTTPSGGAGSDGEAAPFRGSAGRPRIDARRGQIMVTSK
jgi:hypothetical protein